MFRRRRDPSITERSNLRLVDLVTEALSGVLQRPARSVLTMLGTVLGTGAFVAIIGLTSTTAGQIGQRFDVLKQTAVTVTDIGPTDAGDGTRPALDFPKDSSARIDSLNGAVASGLYWSVPLNRPSISASLDLGSSSSGGGSGLPLYAASPGIFDVMHPTLATGVVFNAYHDNSRQRVAVLGAGAARQLGITQVATQPSIFINGTSFTVIGIIGDTQRLPEMLLGVILPSQTAASLYGAPDPAQQPAQMVVEVRLGAAKLIARQAPIALRPDDPALFQATSPVEPHALGDSVNGDLSALLLALAGICLAIGAIGIMNTTLVSVLERVNEIGLRRSLGARPKHIAAQFLSESAVLGTLGGLAGTTIGVLLVVATSYVKNWTAVLEPALVLPAPLIGTALGVIAGLYPALRAASVEPLEALRR